MIEVISPGPLTTVQDLGRPGFAHLGVPRSGAADRPSLRRANRLVGNADAVAALETTAAGPRLRLTEDAVIAVTGADATVRVDGRDHPTEARIEVRAGETVAIGPARAGLRGYVAFAGGVDAPRTLGSASHDTLTKLGPPPLRPGDRLGIGREPGVSPTAADQPPGPPGEPTLPSSSAPARTGSPSRPSSSSPPPASRSAAIRTGSARLHGPPLLRGGDEELLFEALITGALQVPPSGRPILMLVDHPTTGGYPVIGAIPADHLPVAAQLRPGQPLRFAPTLR